VTLSPARRRRIDRIVAGVIALAVLALATVVYLTSDVRATTDATGPEVPAPSAAASVPTSLTEKWSVATDPAIGAVASPYGVVVTAQGTAAVAFDAVTGERRWSYDPADEQLCAIGSGDTDAPGVTVRGKVRGVLVVSGKNGYCSQMMLLDPLTGERHYYRTSPNQAGGTLAFGGPYAGWLGAGLVELWRDDLVRTIQYGDEPAPPKPNATHTGCAFTDMVIDDQQFATVEHCADLATAQVVLNWTTPDSAPNKPDDQDVFKHDPRATIDTGSSAARLVGITSDRVAVLVADPVPAVVLYDTNGTEVGRTPVDVPARSIVDADRLTDTGGTRPTPAVRDGSTRFSVVGDTLIAVTEESASVQTTPTPSLAQLGPSHRPRGYWPPTARPNRSPNGSRTWRWVGQGRDCSACPRSSVNRSCSRSPAAWPPWPPATAIRASCRTSSPSTGPAIADASTPRRSDR